MIGIWMRCMEMAEEMAMDMDMSTGTDMEERRRLKKVIIAVITCEACFYTSWLCVFFSFSLSRLTYTQDTLGSVGVILSTILIDAYEWTGFDPIASLFIAVLIAGSVAPLVLDTGRVLALDVGREKAKDVSGALGEVGVSYFDVLRMTVLNNTCFYFRLKKSMGFIPIPVQGFGRKIAPAWLGRYMSRLNLGSFTGTTTMERALGLIASFRRWRRF